MSELPVFLRGRKTILRPPNKETDLNAMWSWVNDPETTQFVLVFLPQTNVQEGEWFDRIGKDDKNIVLAMEAGDKERKLIGSIGIHQISWKDRVATTGTLIGEKEYWGKGYGTDAKMQILNYCFNTLNLHKICSAVIEYNERSLRYSLHCGYQVEGRRRRHLFRNGRYWDMIELGLFREEWEPIWERYQETGSIKE